MIKETMNGGGFAAGTLVHTDQGLVPIQNIKIGDRVLASPELSTGAIREYKQVVNTYQTAAEIWQLGIACVKTIEDEPCLVREFIYLTQNHPVYLVYSEFEEDQSGRWIPAHKLGADVRIFLAAPESDDDHYMLTIIKPVNKIGEYTGCCDRQDVSFDFDSFVVFSEHGSYETIDHWYPVGNPEGGIFKGNFREFDHAIFEGDEKLADGFKNRTYPYEPLVVPVYKLEVEDFHTYFVGEMGLWVHN